MALKFFAGMNFKFHRKKNGLTLGEILITISILSLIVICIMGTLITGLNAIQKSTDNTRASLMAHRIMENYKAIDYKDIPSGSAIKHENGFEIKTTVTESIYPGTSLSYKKLSVTVRNSSKTSGKNVCVQGITYLFPGN